ncbi:MAG: hypothetical protein ACPL4E_03630 [Thermoproteota archaeon]
MLEEIEGVKEWIQKPFSFQPLWPLAFAAIILVVMIEAPSYLYGISLGDWRFSASILSFAIALFVGALIERFGVKSRGLTLLSFSLIRLKHILRTRINIPSTDEIASGTCNILAVHSRIDSSIAYVFSQDRLQHAEDREESLDLGE